MVLIEVHLFWRGTSGFPFRPGITENETRDLERTTELLFIRSRRVGTPLVSVLYLRKGRGVVG